MIQIYPNSELVIRPDLLIICLEYQKNWKRLARYLWSFNTFKLLSITNTPSLPYPLPKIKIDIQFSSRQNTATMRGAAIIGTRLGRNGFIVPVPRTKHIMIQQHIQPVPRNNIDGRKV